MKAMFSFGIAMICVLATSTYSYGAVGKSFSQDGSENYEYIVDSNDYPPNSPLGAKPSQLGTSSNTKSLGKSMIASAIFATILIAVVSGIVRHSGLPPKAVSYTHLTLPTNREV